MNSLKYKLLALDMDGTLLTDEQEISPETEKWIKKAADAGVHVCLSTGRAFVNAVPYAKQLGLSTPMITVNGSEVWRAPHELHRRVLMDVELIKQLYQIAVEKNTWFWAYSVSGLYNKDSWAKDIEQEEWLKFGYHTEDDEVRHDILMQLQNMKGLEITNSSPYNLEINPQGVSKASGIQEVCKLLDIDMSEAVAVGDSTNDLAAIQAVGLGVAMGNAQQVVKESADVVVASNNEDGIVEVIRDYIL
ncbi:Cof-type HAD-IIB family hydrolase [Paenibacillus sediminis]|uniref:HAD superfamily hydrolase (TIGR01484 family) n=1 Tax=Paenibacillus sediminis TaxID=664909 RepID=A0ABS4H633_9BACL|nr:Cof-type HAD-IIB family hydrolase [Paenibacillus sediminis]MBP1937941.1 HAD superfamily hydrolase (TIGR01484 family) [Paenibacillus sediminis]